MYFKKELVRLQNLLDALETEYQVKLLILTRSHYYIPVTEQLIDSEIYGVLGFAIDDFYKEIKVFITTPELDGISEDWHVLNYDWLEVETDLFATDNRDRFDENMWIKHLFIHEEGVIMETECGLFKLERIK